MPPPNKLLPKLATRIGTSSPSLRALSKGKKSGPTPAFFLCGVPIAFFLAGVVPFLQFLPESRAHVPARSTAKNSPPSVIAPFL